jgi:hypothetical protein
VALLTPTILAAIKATRAKTWTHPFTLEHILETPGADLYDEAIPNTASPRRFNYSGAYIWKPQDHRRGSPGGMFDTADLILCTDILYSGALVFSGAQLVVDGIRCGITSINPIVDFGEVVVTAKKID